MNDKNKRKIILKGRQHGVTTHFCIDYLDDTLFRRYCSSVIIAHKEEVVKDIFKKIQLAYENLDDGIKKLMAWQVNTDNANELSFSHGSSFRVTLSTRGGTVQNLHISEFGKMCSQFPARAEEVISGALPSVPESGRVTIESTAEGDQGYFANMFKDAMHRGEPTTTKHFKALFFGWQENPDYNLKGTFDIPQELRKYQQDLSLTDEQINWYFVERETLKERMRQEYPSNWEEAFETSGNKLFSLDKLREQTPIEGEKAGDWIIYKKYNPSHSYAMGADVSEGVELDSSTAVIIDFTAEEIAVEYKNNKIDPNLFAYELYNFSKQYGNCMIAPERNNHGLTTVTKLKELGAILYIDEKRGSVENGRTKRYGWFTTSGTKPMMIYDLKRAIDEDDLKINSANILQELKTYDRVDLEDTKNPTNHWDLVIATAIAWQMRKYKRNSLQANNVLQDTLSRLTQKSNDKKRYGFIGEN